MKVSTLFAVASTTCCSAFTLPASSRRNTAWSKTRFRAQRSYEDKNASCSKRKSTTTELSANQQQQRQNASWLSSGFAMVMFGMNAMTAAPSSAFADELFIEASIPEPSLSKCECGNNNGASALLAEKKSSSPIVTAVEDSVKKDKAELESVSIPLSAGKAVVVEAISNEIKTDKHDDEKLQKLASNEVRAADPIVAAKSPLPSPSIEKSVTVVEEKKDESASKALIAAAGDHNGDTIVKSNADLSLKYDTESINGGKESSSLTADVKSDANTNSGKGESLVASKPTVEDPSVKNLSASIVPAVITEKEVFSDYIIQPTPVDVSMKKIAKVEEMSDKVPDKEEKIVVAKVEGKSDKVPEKEEKKGVAKVEEKSDKAPEKEEKKVVAKVEEKSDKMPEKVEKIVVAKVEEKSDKVLEKVENNVVAKVGEKSDKAPEKEEKKVIAKVEEKSDKLPEKEEKKVIAKVEEKSDKAPVKEEKKVIAKVEEKSDKAPEKVEKIVAAKVEEKNDMALVKENKIVVAKVEEKSDKTPEKEEKKVVAKVEEKSDKLPEKEEKKSPEQISPELYKLNRLHRMTLTPGGVA